MTGQNFERLIQLTSHELNHLYGEDYFIKLVNKLADIVEADYAFVGKFEDEITHARTIALWGNGSLQDNFSYALKDTPCHDLTSKESCCIPKDIANLYPNDQLLIDMGISAYLGVALKNSLGEIIGLLVALFEEPITDISQKQLIFDIFSVRASSELDRFTYEHLLAEKVTELQQQNQQLQIAGNIFQYANDGLIVSDQHNIITDINPALERMTGYNRGELIGQHLKMLNDDLLPSEGYQAIKASLHASSSWHGEYMHRHKNGDSYPTYNSISTLPDKHNEMSYFITITRDIREEKEAQEKIAYQASHDQLTGLKNRYAFEKQLALTLPNISTGQTGVFLLFDIDNFKTINDSIGHISGDTLLQEITHRLKMKTKETDLISRLGGDEFALFTTVSSQKALHQRVDEIVALFNSPFDIEHGLSVSATTSIGISLYPDDASDTTTLFKNADQALYQAKDIGRNNVAYYNSELKTAVDRHQKVLQRLVQAIDANKIETYFQPIIEIESGRITHCEALARWYDEELGPVQPMEFIHIAESNGLMRQLGPLIFTKATEHIIELNRQLCTQLGVSINQSPQEFIGVSEPDTALIAQAKEKGLSPELICIELTESLTIKNPELAKKHLSSLRSEGISLSMDDFGTGYSSLIYLKHFPFSYIKIDRGFIKDITSDNEDYLIVKTIVEMAHNFGMKTIAEGVETAKHLEMLTAIGCDYAQGYLYTPALPIQEFIAYLEDKDVAGRQQP